MGLVDRQPSRRFVFLAVLALAIPLVFVGLGGYDLDLKGEPREGITAQEILHSNALLPILNGERLPEKPLMFPWLVALSMKVFGETSEWALRFPSAVLATGLLLVVAELGRRLFSARVGLLASAVCATTFLFVRLARNARTDMTLAFFIAAALLLVVVEVQRDEREPDGRPPPWRVALLWATCAAACLTKGPMGIVLPGMVAFAYLAAKRRLRLVWKLATWWGVLLFVVLVGWWYAYGIATHGHEFWFRSFWMENGAMFMGEEGGGGHKHPMWYFIPNYLGWGLPWSPLAVGAMVWAVRRGRGRWSDEPALFPLLWFGALFVFFSVASGKRADYMLPLLPAASLLVAAAADAACAGDVSAKRSLVPGAAILAAVGVVAAALVGIAAWGGVEKLPSKLAEYAAKDDASMFLATAADHRAATAFAVIAVAAAALLPLVGILRGRVVGGIAASTGAIAALLGVAAVVFLPPLSNGDSYKPFAMKVASIVGRGEIRRYEDFETEILFYLDRRVPPVKRAEVKQEEDRPRGPEEDLDVFLAAPGEAWILTDRAAYEGLSAARRARLEFVAADDRPGVAPPDASALLRRIPR